MAGDLRLDELDEGQHRFRVEIGHHRFEVICRTVDDAIARARSLLCDELPRMWDVVHRLTRERFRVTSVDPKQEE